MVFMLYVPETPVIFVNHIVPLAGTLRVINVTEVISNNPTARACSHILASLVHHLQRANMQLHILKKKYKSMEKQILVPVLVWPEV